MGRLTESEKLTLGRPIGGHHEQMNLGLDVTDMIEQWAIDRGLNDADPSKQMLKLMEEVGELAEGLAKDNPDAVQDAIGDAYVVWISVSALKWLTTRLRTVQDAW